MRYKNKNFQIFMWVIWAFLVGCGGEQTEAKVAKEAHNSIEKSVDETKIEIRMNKNAQEIKVKEKKIDKTQSKSYYYDYHIKSEYDPNAKPANKDAAVRVKPRSSVDANIHIRSPYEKVQVSMLVKQLSKKFRVKCSACHDDYANGIIGPSLLSRDADFIYNAITAFKSGKKSNPLMNDLIHMMSEDEIRVIANEIYEFNQQIKEIREKK